MIDTLSSAVLAWLLTYLIHSTALLALAWAITRWRFWSPGATDLFWKAALVGGLVSASVQLGLELRPAGSVSIAPASLAPASLAPQPRSVVQSSPAQPAGAVVASAEIAEIPSTPSVSPAGAPSVAPRNPLPLRGIVVAVWALVGLGLALTYAARRLILVGRIGDRRAVLDGRLLAELDQLTSDARLRRRPRLTCTTRISSPIALGVAEICLPESALEELDLEQQRSMLAHELAHLARRDPIWLAFASVVERVFWFQPLNRLARRGIATSAEYLCDEWAVRRTGSGVALARCLAQIAEWIQASPLGVPVAGMAEERSLLVSRVEKLLAGRFDSRPTRALTLAALAVVVATIAMVPGVTGRSVQAAALGMPQDTQAVHDATREGVREALNEHAAGATQHATADSTVVVALIGRLKDEDAEVRAAAAQALGKLEDSRAVPALLASIGDRDAKVRAAAADALGKFTDPRAVNGLSSLLADPELDVRKQALEALSEYESGVPVAGIVRLLSDPDADLRHSAVHALGRFGDRSIGAGLVPLVRDPSPDVRQAAIESIANLHDAAHASAILPALSDGNADVRQQALEALGELRASIPEATLLALLRDGDSDVRSKAAEVAGERSVVAAIPSLRRMMDDPDRDVRENAVSALSNIADDAAIAALRAGLASKDAKVRRASAEALGDRRQ